jgi:Family of unknown function (DUF6193)
MFDKFLKLFNLNNSKMGIDYSEIEKFGGLGNALNIEFEKINSNLKVSTGNHIDELPFVYALVEKDNKFSQIYTAAEEKLYLPDFWKDGVCLANGQTEDFNKLAKVLDYWHVNDVTTQQLYEKFSFINPNEQANAFDENREVEYKWELIHNDPYKEELKPFVDLAIEDEILSKLFPFTSLNRLCFSRCTGYPYTYDTPIIIPIGNDVFEVRLPDDKLVGAGSAIEILKIAKNYLPLDIKPAIKGTSDDIK